jgi:adenylate kinase family enzyme
MKIGIAGCAGTGKSVLAEKLATEMGIPFLPAKEITGEILSRDGYDYASGQQVEKFLATRERQEEILRRTIQQHSAKEFVTDRTAVDLAAYSILEMRGALTVKLHLEACKTLAKKYTHIIFCPWENCKVEDNHKRTLDPWYQFAVHSVELQVIEMFDLAVCQLTSSKVDDRLQEAIREMEVVSK